MGEPRKFVRLFALDRDAVVSERSRNFVIAPYDGCDWRKPVPGLVAGLAEQYGPLLDGPLAGAPAFDNLARFVDSLDLH